MNEQVAEQTNISKHTMITFPPVKVDSTSHGVVISALVQRKHPQELGGVLTLGHPTGPARRSSPLSLPIPFNLLQVKTHSYESPVTSTQTSIPIEISTYKHKPLRAKLRNISGSMWEFPLDLSLISFSWIIIIQKPIQASHSFLLRLMSVS